MCVGDLRRCWVWPPLIISLEYHVPAKQSRIKPSEEKGNHSKNWTQESVFEHMCVYSVASVMFDSLQHYGLLPARLLSPWDFPGKTTGMGYHFLFQGIFLTQGLKPHLLYCKWILLSLSHWGSIGHEYQVHLIKKYGV